MSHKSCYKCKVCGKIPVENEYRHHMGALYCAEDAKNQPGTPEWLDIVFHRNTNPFLDLKNCHIFNDGASKIAELLQDDTTVVELDITCIFKMPAYFSICYLLNHY